MSLAEVELPSGSLVIADLHLVPEGAEPSTVFLDWLERVGGAPRVLILGDLFEYWVGPAQAEWEGPRRVLEGLARTVSRGTAIDVVPGNRDFLLDRAFEERTGCRVHHAGLVGRTDGGTRVLFLHGDELATLDRPYQRLRRVIRSRPVRWLARVLPGWVSARIARRLRRASRRAIAAKPAPHMALQPDECRARARASGADVVVCGHAHRFQDERLEGGPRWVVLDAFGGRRDTLGFGAEERIEAHGSRDRGAPAPASRGVAGREADPDR